MAVTKHNICWSSDPQGIHQIDAIAETLAMSKRSLQRLLADEGRSYSEMLTEVRQCLAVDWLETTEKSIGQIAYDLGYSDSSNFARAFHRQLGTSPQAFRNNGEKGLLQRG